MTSPLSKLRASELNVGVPRSESDRSRGASRLGWLRLVAASVAAIGCWLAAGCSSTDASRPCATGEMRPCSVRLASGEVVSCMVGSQTCQSGIWGACVPSGTVISSGSTGSGGGLGIESGSSMACNNDPCNPDCRFFQSDDGGVAPDASSDAGGYLTGSVPLSALPSGWTKVDGVPCSGTADCEFDSKCVAGTCTRFQPGESGSCSGVDLTVASACDSATGSVFPVCNRGTLKANTGTVKLGFDMNPPPGGTCAPTASPYPDKGSCDIDLSKVPIAPGACVNINPAASTPGVTCTNVNVSGNRDSFINYDGKLAECNKCNNEGMKKAGVTCSSVSTTTYQTTTFVQQYTATCPTGKAAQWSALAWVASVPSSNGSASRLLWTGRIGDGTTWTSSATLGDTSAGDPATCGLFGPSPCPKDLTTAFNVKRPILELTITLIPSADGLVAPTVSTWQVTYNCVDAY